MELKELKPVLDLISALEERVIKKVDDLHSDVRRINGNVARHEVAIQEQKLTCQAVQDLKAHDKEIKSEIRSKAGRRLSRRQWVALFVVSMIMSVVAIGGFVISIINITLKV